MRQWVIRIVGVTTLCALSFGLGVGFDSSGPENFDVVDLEDFGDEDRASWRELLPALRASADGDQLRYIALDTLDVAESDVARAEAIQVLGWVGADEDAELLYVFVIEGPLVISHEAIEALGHLGTPSAVDYLVQLHERNDPKWRNQVLSALGASGSEVGLEILEESLDDPNVSSWAAWGLAANGSNQAARVLVRAFEDSGSKQAWGHANALATFPNESVPAARAALRKALRGGDADKRQAAMNALASVRDPGIYEALVKAATSNNTNVQYQGISALGTLGDERAVPVLERIARDGSVRVRTSAVYAIGSIGGDSARMALVELVEVGPSDTAGAAAAAVPDLGEPDVVEVLLWAIDNRGTSVRDQARNRLFSNAWPKGSVPEEILDIARDHIRNAGGNTWAGNAYTFLLQHGDAGDEDMIREILFEGSAQQKSDALYALQTQPDLLSNDLLLELLQDGDPNVRRSALSALQSRGDEVSEELQDVLLERLEDGTGGMGWDDTEQALASLGTATARRALMERVEGGTGQEARRALSAIVYGGDAEQIDELYDILQSAEDEDVRRRIYDTMLYSNAPNVEDFVQHALDEEDPRIASSAVSALGRLGTPESRDQILDLLDHDAIEVRSAAMSAMAQQGGPDAERILLEGLEDEEMSSYALSGLQTLGTKGAREALVDVARSSEDTNLRTQALYAIAWNGGAEGETAIIDALGDEDETVRSTAIYAIQTGGSTNGAVALGDFIADGDPEDPAMVQAAQVLQGMGGSAAEDHSELIEEILGSQGDTMMYDTGIRIHMGEIYFE